MKFYSIVAAALLAGGASLMAPAESSANPPRRDACVRVMPARMAPARTVYRGPVRARHVHRSRVHYHRHGHARTHRHGSHVIRHQRR